MAPADFRGAAVFRVNGLDSQEANDRIAGLCFDENGGFLDNNRECFGGQMPLDSFATVFDAGLILPGKQPLRVAV